MSLRGQDGYAMAALLVALAVMAVLMSVALPVWRHDAQREKEEELVWRGQQYVRAIRLYQRRTQGLPPSFDALVQGRYIRKRYKDPITNEDFEAIGQGGLPGQPGQAPGGRAGAPGAAAPSAGAPSSSFGSASSGAVPGGMMGVRSKSKDESIRLYLGRNHYNEWAFVFVSQLPGGPGGRGQPGGPGGRGQPGRQGGRGGGLGTDPFGGGGGPLPFPPSGPGRGGPGGGGPGGGGPGRGGRGPGGPGGF